MFDLTRREVALVAGFVVVFLLGLGTMQWRAMSGLPKSPPAAEGR